MVDLAIMSKCRVCREREAAPSYKGKCLQCGRLYQQRWRKANRKKVRAYRKKWYEEHKNDADIDNSRYPVPVRLKGRVEECRAMQGTKWSTKPCEGCGKERTLYCEVGDCWVCRECHVKYH